MLSYVNALLHLIFENQNEFIRVLFNSKEDFDNYQKWLKQRGIEFNWLNNIDTNSLNLVLKRTSVKEIEAMLHINISDEIDNFIEQERKYTHHILINTDSFFKTNPNDRIYSIQIELEENSYFFINPAQVFNVALLEANHWPGTLTITQQKTYFTSKNYKNYQDQQSYFIHLSDLHLGTRKNNNGKVALLRSLDHFFETITPSIRPKILITGDLMNSPNRKNMYLASGFINDLKKRYHSDITFILGNHDMIVHGLNLFKTQKAKVVAYLLDENIKVLEKEKIILIKINSAYEGYLARGKVGALQLREIDNELSTIDCLHEYQMIVMIHHHVFPIDKAEFLKRKWNEHKVIAKLIDSSKELIDSDLLVDWLKKRHIRYILHGHKHIPFFKKHQQFFVVSCGSSCGIIKESKIKYLSYNVLKYDIATKKMELCLIYYDSLIDHQRRIELHFMD